MGAKKQGGGGGDPKGLLWRLPKVTSKELGKIGPALGIGIGCGAGAGVGFFGGAGLGYGFPGLTLGFGVGAGCGVGIGFGYGLGKGIAYDENKRYSNVGKMFQEAPHLPTCLLAAFQSCTLLVGSLSFLHKRTERRIGSPSWLGQKFRNLCDIAAS